MRERTPDNQTTVLSLPIQSYRTCMGPGKKGSCEKNSTFTLTGVERLMNEELDNVTQAQCASCVRHAEKFQEEDFLKEIGRHNFGAYYHKFTRD